MSLAELNNDLHRWIDLREGIQREINVLKPKPGENTGRREDRIRDLEAQYADVQKRILDIDQQIRNIQKTHINAR